MSPSNFIPNALGAAKAVFVSVHKDETGQAFAEYMVILAATVVALSSAFTLFDDIVGDYYLNVTRWISLPFP